VNTDASSDHFLVRSFVTKTHSNKTMPQDTNIQPEMPIPAITLKPWAVIAVNIHALLLTAGIVWVSFYAGQPATGPVPHHLNLLVGILGCLLGWFVGTLASPYDKPEAQRFISLGQAVSLFVSGVLVSKIDRFLESALFDKDGIYRDAWERAGIFAAAFLLMALVTYVNRTYYSVTRSDPRPIASLTAGTSAPVEEKDILIT